MVEWRDWWLERARTAREGCQAFLMWLRASLVYFTVQFHPNREDTTLPLYLKNFAPEMEIFFHGLAGLLQATAQLLDAALIERHRFQEYLRSLIQDESGWFILYPDIPKDSHPDGQLLRFMDTVGQFRTLAYHMGQTPWLAYPAFVMLGRIYRHYVLNTSLGAWVMPRGLIPGVDATPHPIVRTQYYPRVPEPVRTTVAWLMAKFYQWLAYLDHLPPLTEEIGILKRTYMVVVLLRAELHRMVRRWERLRSRAQAWPDPWPDRIESILFALQMEFRKVVHREMLGFPEIPRAAGLYTRIENTRGILRNALQNAIVDLIQVVCSDVAGADLFPDHRTRLEQSLRLREDLWALRQMAQDIARHQAWNRWQEIVAHFRRFRTTTMHYLMYRDWAHLDGFYRQFQEAHTPGQRKAVLDQFKAFLDTLIGQVNQREVLRNHPFPYPLGED